MRTAYSKRKRRAGGPTAGAAVVTDSGNGINIYRRCEDGVGGWREMQGPLALAAAGPTPQRRARRSPARTART